jgi:hypothetical protein
MKKIIFTICLLTITLCHSQMKVSTVEKPIEIGKVGAGFGILFAKLEKYQDGNFVLSYKDFKFQQIEEWKSFVLSSEDVEPFYNLLIENFEKMPKDDIRVELPKDLIDVNYKKSFGISVVTLYHFPNKNPEVIGLSQSFTKKQIMKLFGKNK